MTRLLAFSFVVASGLLLGCATLGDFAATGEVAVVYGADADENLALADKAMAAKNFDEAARYYEHVKTKYPFLEAAKTAELRLADTDFERDRFVEARDRYQSFVRLHPTHAQVDYAAFRAALTHYRDIPSDFVLLPSSTEKDQVEVRGALAALTEFVSAYPESTHLTEAKEVLQDVRRRLAQHELTVADFYAKRERWPAVVGRLSVVAERFPGTGLDERVAFGLYEAHRKLKDEKKAAEALRVYAAKFPEEPGARRALAILASLSADSRPEAPRAAPDAGR